MVKGKKLTKKSIKPMKPDQQKELQRRLELERLRQLESSSTTSSDIESSESDITLYEPSEEEDVIDIFEALYDSEIESLQEEEPEYVQRKTLIEEPDFFDAFGELPNMDNISEDITIASVVIEKPATEEIDPKKDIGKFVNPLTGLDIRESIQSKSSTSDGEHRDADEIEEDEAEESSKDKDFSEESELMLPTDALDLIEEDKKPATMDDTLEAFFEMDIQPVVVEKKEIDWETLAREEEAKRVQKNTWKFLNELINKAVETSEYMSPEKFLQQNLDKRKLVRELADKLPEYFKEQSYSSFLNRQIVHYFRRKKSFRAIMEDNPKTIDQDKQKLKDAKIHLDLVMSKETKLKNYFEKILADLNEQYRKQKEEAEIKIQLFENKVKKVLGHEHWPKTNALIDYLLLQMGKYRQEVSDVRLALVLQQHSQAHLEELLNKLEDLGNGLNMKDFSHLQAETQALDKKIEEHNAELNKFYMRCHNNLHTMASYKEKQKMLTHTVTVQQSLLESLVEEKRILRERLFTLKLQRTRMNAQIKRLRIQGGLLDKPSLMLDYDRTIERCRERKQINNYLKQTLWLIQRKINEISKYCPAMKIK